MANGLANLIAKKAAANESKAGAPVETAPDTNESAGSGASEGGTEPVQGPSDSQPPATPSPRNPFAPKPPIGSGDSGGQPSGGDSASSGSTSGGGESRPKLAGLNLGTQPQPASESAGSVASTSIASLDDLDQSESDGIAPRPSVSGFSDETPATAPTRELPKDLPKEALQFIDLIDGVYSVLHEPDMLGGAIRNILVELKSHPEYMKLVAPEDIRAWVRGMRDSMGLARIKKQESKSKRSGGSGKKSGLVDKDMLADLDSLVNIEV